MVNPTTSPLIFSKLLYNIYLPLPIFLPPTNKNYLVIFLNPSPPELPFLRSLPYTANAAQRRRLNASYLTGKNYMIKECRKTPPAVSRSITWCSRKGISGEYPLGEGVETNKK